MFKKVSSLNNLNRLKLYWEIARNDQRVPLILTTIFAILIILQLLQLFSVFEAGLSIKIPTPTSTTPLQPSPNIAHWHLFGLYERSIQNIPITRLQLTLEGTVVNVVNPKNSYALISSPGQPTKIYKIGQTLPGGAIIRQILKDRIIIDENGNLESLLLPIPKLQKSGTSKNGN